MGYCPWGTKGSDTTEWLHFHFLRKLKQGLCINLEGWDGKGDEREFQERGVYVYLWLIHVEIWQKTTKFCKAIILQLKINKLKKKLQQHLVSDRKLWKLIIKWMVQGTKKKQINQSWCRRSHLLDLSSEKIMSHLLNPTPKAYEEYDWLWYWKKVITWGVAEKDGW